MQFLPFVIIRKITFLKCSELCSEIYVCLISFLCRKNQTLTAIDLLFASKFSPFFKREEKYISFRTYKPMNRRIFVIFRGSLQVRLWLNTEIIAYWTHFLSSSFFGFFVTFLLALFLGEVTYDPSQLILILWNR